MDALTVAATYGAAMLEVARDLNKIEETDEALATLDQIFRDEPDFFNLVRSPGIGAKEKKKVLETVLENRVEKELLNFLFILIDKRRIGGFHAIAKAYRAQVNANLGVSIGTAYSAVPLSEDRRRRLEEETGKLLKKNVRLDNLIDSEIIGGVRIFVEGKLIDASVRQRLDTLREQLAQL
ncbi:MAG: F0F1 ATP synthase subunit delta [Clostridiales Family XIII bacterium]|jgi:ATP synthase F1 delta subunit|nr:F0F1 ATP synthase subunit delta [Clostridiales Family XIII bacterium]